MTVLRGRNHYVRKRPLICPSEASGVRFQRQTSRQGGNVKCMLLIVTFDCRQLSIKDNWTSGEEAHHILANGSHMVGDRVEVARQALLVDTHSIHFGGILDDPPPLPSHPRGGVSNSYFPWLGRAALNIGA